MPTSKQLHRLATRPADLARYMTSGKLPQGVRPQSPLLTLLRGLNARDLGRIRGVTIDSRLGYTGHRQFATLAQALHWLAPSEEVFGAFPAESWRDKRFNKALYLNDLAECCTGFPVELLEHYRRRCRPQKPSNSG